MKRLLAVLLCLFLLPGCALADPVSFGGVSFDSEADYIDLGDQVVTKWDDYIAFLRKFPNLKKVDMFATQITEDKVNKLVAALPDIEFGWTLQLMKYKNKHIVRTDAEAFSTLHGICPNHQSKEFTLLKYCTKLKGLDLGHNNLTDISFLLNMPHLKVLILGENQKLKNISVIGELQELEYLELFTCGITDISPLTNLHRLMDLNLANNNVKDWRPLKEMTWLKRLWISGMTAKKMTAAEKQELQDALPDTEIMFTGEPTENGWRKTPVYKVEHPHYAVVYEMFQTGVYIPFEDSVDTGTDGDSAEDASLTLDEIDPSELLDGN